MIYSVSKNVRLLMYISDEIRTIWKVWRRIAIPFLYKMINLGPTRTNVGVRPSHFIKMDIEPLSFPRIYTYIYSEPMSGRISVFLLTKVSQFRWLELASKATGNTGLMYARIECMLLHGARSTEPTATGIISSILYRSGWNQYWLLQSSYILFSLTTSTLHDHEKQP